MPRVVDANVLLRHYLGDHKDHSPRARALIEQLEQGGLSVRIPDTAFFEAVFVLEKSYRQRKLSIAEALIPLVDSQSVEVDFPERLRVAFSLYSQYNLSFGDAYIAAVAMETNREVISFDRDFDRIPGIERVEP